MIEKQPLSITFLIGNWVSASMLFLAGQAVFQTGALAGLVIVAALFSAFILIIPLLKFKSLYDSPGVHSLIKKCISFLWYLEAMVMNLLIGFLILHRVFHINFYFAILGNCSLMFLLTLICKRWGSFSKGILFSNLSLLFGLAIFLPIYIYLQEGLETVYHNLLHYHPKVLFLTGRHYLTYYLACLVIFLGKLYLQLPALDRFAGPVFGKGIRKLSAAVVIYATLFLAFSTMTIVAITQDFPSMSPNEVLLFLIEKKSAPLVFQLVCIVLYLLSLLSVVNIHFELMEEYQWGENSIILLMFLYSNYLAVLLYVHHISLLEIYAISGLSISLAALLQFIAVRVKVIILKKV